MGKGAEKKHRPAKPAQHQKAPQLTGAPAQQKQEGGRAHRQTVAAVQQARQAGKAEPERAQQVIQHTRGQAQQNGLAKGQKLGRHLTPHGSSEQAA